MFSVEKANYNLTPVKFNGDDPLGSHIKEPFPNYSFFWLICGKPGSGKTSLLINSLVMKGDNRIYNKVFDKITLVMPRNSVKSIVNNPFHDLPADQHFEKFTPAVVSQIAKIRDSFDDVKKDKPIDYTNVSITSYVNKITEDSKKVKTDDKKISKKSRNKRQLLILDDVTAYLKDDPSLLIELATNRRHFKLSIVLMVQFLRAVPLPVRSQVTTLTVFKPANEKETEIIKEEYINMKKELFNDLTRWVWETKHDFLMIDKDNSLYYKNLQKINFPTVEYNAKDKSKKSQESKDNQSIK